MLMVSSMAQWHTVSKVYQSIIHNIYIYPHWLIPIFDGDQTTDVLTYMDLPSGKLIAIENGHRNSGDFPIKNGGSFHCYVNVYQRILNFWCSKNPSISSSTPKFPWNEWSQRLRGGQKKLRYLTAESVESGTECDGERFFFLGNLPSGNLT